MWGDLEICESCTKKERLCDCYNVDLDVPSESEDSSSNEIGEFITYLLYKGIYWVLWVIILLLFKKPLLQSYLRVYDVHGVLHRDQVLKKRQLGIENRGFIKKKWLKSSPWKLNKKDLKAIKLYIIKVIRYAIYKVFYPD